MLRFLFVRPTLKVGVWLLQSIVPQIPDPRDGTLSSMIKDLEAEGLGLGNVEEWGCWIFDHFLWAHYLSSGLVTIARFDPLIEAELGEDGIRGCW